MATDTESFNRDLYDLLKVRGYDPTPLDSKNQRVSASQDADVIEFTFKKDGEDYGNAWVTVDDAQNVIIYYDNEQQDSPSTTTPGVDYDDSWTGLLKFLKNWAQRRQMSFELSNKDRLGDDMRQRDYYKMKEKLGESYHPMGKKASYNDAVPSVKIILQHNRSLEEGEARFRNVARIFLENQDGERFLAPTTRPGIARVYARHIAEGGLPNDERWNHIKGLCEEYNKMAGFVRATRNKEFNESVQQLVQEGANHYNNLRETLSKLTGHRGYQNYFESWTPTLLEGEVEDLSEMFMSQSLDPRIESAMPILSRLYKPVTEMHEVDSLAEWADEIISEKLEMDSTTKSMAVPADEMLDEAPGAQTLAHNQSTEKSNLKKLGLAEDEGIFVVSALPERDPKKFRATSRDEAAEKAARTWGVPIEKITVHGSSNAPTKPAKTTDDSKADTPDDGTALSRATKRAESPKAPWYSHIAKPLLGIHEGDVVPFKKKHEDDDEDDWDDESWIPSIEDFEQEEEIRQYNKNRRKPANDINEMEKDLYQGRRHDPRKGPQGLDKTAKAIPAKKAAKDAGKLLNKAFKGEMDEATGYYKEKHPKHDQMTKDGYEHSIEDILGDKLHRYFKPGVSLVDLYKYDDEEVKEELTPVPSGHKGLNKQQKSVGQLGATEKAKNISPVLGKEPKQHPFKGKLVGASESVEMDPELARIIEMAKFKK